MKQYADTTNTIITFIKDTKDGKYADIENGIIEVPRSTLSRDEYVFEEEEMSVFFSMSN